MNNLENATIDDLLRFKETHLKAMRHVAISELKKALLEDHVNFLRVLHTNTKHFNQKQEIEKYLKSVGEVAYAASTSKGIYEEIISSYPEIVNRYVDLYLFINLRFMSDPVFSAKLTFVVPEIEIFKKRVEAVFLLEAHHSGMFYKASIESDRREAELLLFDVQQLKNKSGISLLEAERLMNESELRGKDVQKMTKDSIPERLKVIFLDARIETTMESKKIVHGLNEPLTIKALMNDCKKLVNNGD